MNRRGFNQSMLALPIGAFLTFIPPLSSNSMGVSRAIKKPKRLQKGDTIGLITPGSYISDEGLEKAVTNIEGLGFTVKLSKNIRAKHGFNAGTDQQRLDDLHQMFADNQIKGVWCARGGYGCGRLLPYIDYRLIKQNPKVLIGYSDITALLQAIYCKTGMIGFHGPVGASDFTDYTVTNFRNVLMESKTNYIIKTEPSSINTVVFQHGQAEGQLVGGNLSLLASLVGTDFQLDLKGKLLFIEEIGEKPYRIDRMLTQLKQATNIQKVAGIALGTFEDCEPEEGDNSLSLLDTLKSQFSDFKVPIIYGLSFGHIANQCTLPVGLNARLITKNQTITLLETAVL